jgi:hypothetical protein
MTAPDRAQLIGLLLIVGIVVGALWYLRGGPGAPWSRLERLSRAKFGPRERLIVLLVMLGIMVLVSGVVLLAIFH